jgi:hypothetical protein
MDSGRPEFKMRWITIYKLKKIQKIKKSEKYVKKTR